MYVSNRMLSLNVLLYLLHMSCPDLGSIYLGRFLDPEYSKTDTTFYTGVVTGYYNKCSFSMLRVEIEKSEQATEKVEDK